MEANAETQPQPIAHGNLDYFLRARFDFARNAIPEGATVLGIGGGSGLIRNYLPELKLVDSDIVAAPWLDLVCDGQTLPFADGSFDACVAMAVLHHLRFPRQGLKELARVVRPGGKACIQEPHASLTLRLILSMFRHEYFDFAVNPFGEAACVSSKSGPNDGNNAVGDLLFKDQNKFEREIPEFRIISHKYRHFLLYLNSGSLTGEMPHVPLPRGFLRFTERLDNGLCRIAHKVFATCQEVVLERLPTPQ